MHVSRSFHDSVPDCDKMGWFSRCYIHSSCFVSQAHVDHFDLVSRRMGFIPLPLGSLVSYSRFTLYIKKTALSCWVFRWLSRNELTTAHANRSLLCLSLVSQPPS